MHKQRSNLMEFYSKDNKVFAGLSPSYNFLSAVLFLFPTTSLKTSLNKSPFRCSLFKIVSMVKSDGSNPFLISFQSSGVETDGMVCGRTLYAEASVSA